VSELLLLVVFAVDCDAQHTITFKRKNTKAELKLYNIQGSV